MNNLIEIRWHGRGGQGAKTASLLLADAAFNTGKYIQGFPEYGPERMGAPITAYNRISDKPITIHSNIYEPDYVVVVDDTLLTAVPVTAGLKKDGAIVINTTKKPEELNTYRIFNECLINPITYSLDLYFEDTKKKVILKTNTASTEYKQNLLVCKFNDSGSVDEIKLDYFPKDYYW